MSCVCVDDESLRGMITGDLISSYLILSES